MEKISILNKESLETKNNNPETKTDAKMNSSLDKELSGIAKTYINLKNENLEKGLNYLLGETKKLSGEDDNHSPSLEYLNGVLNMEMCLFLKKHHLPEKKKMADSFLENSFSNFEKAAESKEKFSIFIQNDGKEILFGNNSLASAYLGDIFVKKSLTEKNPEKRRNYWEKGKSFYQEAIMDEKDRGVKAEFETILAVRNIAEKLGNEKDILCEKTTRRRDLNHNTADVFLTYHDTETKETFSSYIDVTKDPKYKNKGHLDTAILDLSENIGSAINTADYDLEKILNKAEKEIKTSQRYSNDTRLKLFSAFQEFTNLAETLSDFLHLTGKPALNFKKVFFINPEKIGRISPAGVSKEQFVQSILSISAKK